MVSIQHSKARHNHESGEHGLLPPTSPGDKLLLRAWPSPLLSNSLRRACYPEGQSSLHARGKMIVSKAWPLPKLPPRMVQFHINVVPATSPEYHIFWYFSECHGPGPWLRCDPNPAGMISHAHTGCHSEERTSPHLKQSWLDPTSGVGAVHASKWHP